jgi:hypothetical protein
MTAITEPHALAETLAALVDLLLPGDKLFPPASSIGVQAKLADRLIELRDPSAVLELVGRLEDLGAEGGLDRTALERFERGQPEEFLLIRNLVYLAFYESPAVHEAIRALGFIYHAVPLPAGYEVGKFDPATDLPRHGRGRFVSTEEVRRVDLSRLDWLELDRGSRP